MSRVCASLSFVVIGRPLAGASATHFRDRRGCHRSTMRRNICAPFTAEPGTAYAQLLAYSIFKLPNISIGGGESHQNQRRGSIGTSHIRTSAAAAGSSSPPLSAYKQHDTAAAHLHRARADSTGHYSTYSGSAYYHEEQLQHQHQQSDNSQQLDRVDSSGGVYGRGLAHQFVPPQQQQQHIYQPTNIYSNSSSSIEYQTSTVPPFRAASASSSSTSHYHQQVAAYTSFGSSSGIYTQYGMASGVQTQTQQLQQQRQEYHQQPPPASPNRSRPTYSPRPVGAAGAPGSPPAAPPPPPPPAAPAQPQLQYSHHLPAYTLPAYTNHSVSTVARSMQASLEGLGRPAVSPPKGYAPTPAKQVMHRGGHPDGAAAAGRSPESPFQTHRVLLHQLVSSSARRQRERLLRHALGVWRDEVERQRRQEQAAATLRRAMDRIALGQRERDKRKAFTAWQSAIAAAAVARAEETARQVAAESARVAAEAEDRASRALAEQVAAGKRHDEARLKAEQAAADALLLAQQATARSSSSSLFTWLTWMVLLIAILLAFVSSPTYRQLSKQQPVLHDAIHVDGRSGCFVIGNRKTPVCHPILVHTDDAGSPEAPSDDGWRPCHSPFGACGLENVAT